MLPPHERFDTDEPGGADGEDRLVEDVEFVALERKTDLAFEVEAARHLFA